MSMEYEEWHKKYDNRNGCDENGFTDCKDNHKQSCPTCKVPLECTHDHYGGGSHYWCLKCLVCGTEFYYDTYRFELEVSRKKHPNGGEEEVI